MAGAAEQDLSSWWASRQSDDMVQWTRVSGEMTDLVSGLAARRDLVAVVEPGAAAKAGAPAMYEAEMAHIAIDTDICAQGVDPADIRLRTTTGQLRHPALVGAGDHEGAHAHAVHGTRWTIDQDPSRRAVVGAALLLEEPRIERYHLLGNPDRRVFLRAAFEDLVRGSTDIGGMRHAAHTACLAHGRVDAGVLEIGEVADLVEKCVAVLGPEVYGRLRATWLEALDLAEPAQDQIEALGQRWLDILQEAGAEESEEEPLLLVCRGDGESKTGDGDLGSVASAVSAAAKEEARRTADAIDARAASAARAAEAAVRSRAEKEAAGVFDLPIGHTKGYGDGALLAPRPATGMEESQSAVLAGMISRARFREHARTSVRTSTPPGRLDMSEALKRSAQISNGLPPTAQPWRRTRRTYTERPPITVGIGCDISGSMRNTAAGTASACWVVADAVHRVGGRVAAVAYAQRIHPVVRPGVRPSRVQPFRSNGGSEDWPGAMRALDGALRLRDGSGVRLAVFISDGHYAPERRAAGEAMAAAWLARGVKILWLGFNGSGWDDDRPVEGSSYVLLANPSTIGTTIGRTLVELLERA